MPLVLLVHSHILPLRFDHRLKHRLVLDVRVLGRGRRCLRRSDRRNSMAELRRRGGDHRLSRAARHGVPSRARGFGGRAGGRAVRGGTAVSSGCSGRGCGGAGDAAGRHYEADRDGGVCGSQVFAFVWGAGELFGVAGVVESVTFLFPDVAVVAAGGRVGVPACRVLVPAVLGRLVDALE